MINYRSSLFYIAFFALAVAGCQQETEHAEVQPEQPWKGAQASDSLNFTQKKVSFTDPYCDAPPCSSILFSLPQSADKPVVNAAIDSAAVAAWGRYSSSFATFTKETFYNWHEEFLEYQELDEEDESDEGGEVEFPDKHLITKGTVLFNRYGLVSIRYDLENRFDEEVVGFECAFLNLDSQQGKPLTITDLLKPNRQEQFITVAEEAFYSQYRFRLNSQLEGCQLRFDRCRFILPDYFAVTESAIILEYKPNELGPAWMGNPPIVLPYQQIQSLLKPDGPLGWAIERPDLEKGKQEKQAAL